MKVSIIAFNNLSKCPYIKPYVKICNDHNISCEVIFPNRENIEEKAEYPIKEIGWNTSLHKFYNFLNFRKEVIAYLNQNTREFVVVLTTMPAVLLSDYLVRKYKGKYLVDIRDYTYENVLPYYLLEKYAIKHAAMNVISSPGFLKFLPDAKYHLCHNVNEEYRKEQSRAFRSSQKKCITIGYVGSIAYKEQCLALIKLVEKDSRFRFDLYGNEVGESCVTKYLSEHPCDRIRMFGPYQPCEKIAILSSVDLLFNAYGNGNNLLDYALSNKLYDSFFMRIPLLTSPHTSMSNEAGDFSFDIDFNNDSTLDSLYEWYWQIDGDKFNDYSEQYMRNVFRDQDEFFEQLRKVILGDHNAADCLRNLS